MTSAARSYRAPDHRAHHSYQFLVACVSLLRPGLEGRAQRQVFGEISGWGQVEVDLFCDGQLCSVDVPLEKLRRFLEANVELIRHRELEVTLNLERVLSNEAAGLAPEAGAARRPTRVFEDDPPPVLDPPPPQVVMKTFESMPLARDPERVPTEISWRRLGVIESCWLATRFRAGATLEVLAGAFDDRVSLSDENRYTLDKSMHLFYTEVERIWTSTRWKLPGKAQPPALPTPSLLRYRRRVLTDRQCVRLEEAFRLTADDIAPLERMKLVDASCRSFDCFRV